MAEALDARELVEALNNNGAARPKTIADLPKELLVSIFIAAENPTWVRHTFPLVCRAWNELYRTKDASPLHETLEVDFGKEVGVVAREWEGEYDEEDDLWVLPVVHASRVLAWAERRAGSVRKLLLRGGWLREEMDGDLPLEDFKAKDLGALVAVAGSSLTDISIGPDFRELLKRPFWESLRDSVVPAGRLRSFVVADIDADTFRSGLEPLLGQLAGSLEELELNTDYSSEDRGLPRFPESLFALKELRHLALTGHSEITAIPAGISSLKKLKDLDLRGCGLGAVPSFVRELKSLESLALCYNGLSSLPKELGELSGLTKLDVGGNRNLGTTAEAFPAELGKMKPLRDLDLRGCGLGAVPSFVRELKSLESLTIGANGLSSLPKELGELSGLTKLDVGGNRNLGTTAEAFPAELGKMKPLRDLDLRGCGLRTVPSFVGKLESLESLTLQQNDLSSLPKELGELSGLTKLDLSWNESLGNTLPVEEAFPAELGNMKCLRELDLFHCRLRTVPAFVGKLESLESLNLQTNDLSSLPKELGELSRLTKLNLSCDESLGTTLPADEAFPAELGNMKCLRELELSFCGLSAVPAFLGELESLESLDLSYNDNLQIDAPLDFLIEGCPRLREVTLSKYPAWDSWTPESLANLEAFKAKLRAKKPDAEVHTSHVSVLHMRSAHIY